jgi:NADPH-dependent 2,4-dienoyl-CoA reductase/sulfur reductase-like enzyme/ferredoxin
MDGEAVIEIREPARAVRQVSFDRALEIGHDCDGVLIDDDGVSRRHLELVPGPVNLSATDLGSVLGTTLNGRPIDGVVSVEPGDVLRIGQTEIVLVRGLTPSSAGRQTDGPPTASDPAPPRQSAAPIRLAKRIIGYQGTSEPAFPAYTELPHRMPRAVWYGIRVVSVAAYLALCVALFVRPAGGLFWLFKVVVPLLPILFFVAPGLWRNICPLAASNQTPRLFGFTRGLTAPRWLARWGYVVAICLFLGIAAARLALFNNSGTATAVLLLAVIVAAFFGGVFLKGKSGWCSSICPLLPVQRVYGQTPFVTVANSHCQPCVGCTKNCYDFNPRVAYQADLHDPDPNWSSTRKLFASALPGFVLGFYLLVNQSGSSRVHLYEHLGLYVVASIGIFFALDALLPLSTSLLIAFFASAAINIFYWYGGAILANSFLTITGVAIPWVRWPIRAAVLVLTLIWIARTYFTERRYLEQSAPASQPITITPKLVRQQASAGDLSVTFLPEEQLSPAEVGMSLLEVAEKAGQTIESGCRMGVCGADPVAVLEGGECLSSAEDEELNTLKRLGLAANTRMACSARLESGAVKVSLTPEKGDGVGATSGSRDFDRSIVRVVVVGNGIAGVTAADFVRRGHPECEIHLVGNEPHVMYNRMGISRLVYGRSAMRGLYLLDENWYDEHGITAWLNTTVTEIDLDSNRVTLGSGEAGHFDRLILCMGSNSFVPPIDGFGSPGTFVLRQAEDAMKIRAYAQDHRSRAAVIAGAGLLGLEAARSLHELGLHVTVLDRGDRLLSAQVDARCSELLEAHFERLGIEILHGAETAAVRGPESVEEVLLKNDRILPCDIFLACVGIRPNIKVAQEAGLATGRGILVNDRMETSAPGVFAAGDVAEFGGQVLGLWPTASKQAEIAAVNALGGDERVSPEAPATILKGVGLELTSVGRLEASGDDEVIVTEDAARWSYRRLVISEGRVVGMVVLGRHPDDVASATAAIKKQTDVSPDQLEALRRGEWQVLKARGARPQDSLV